MRRQKIGMGISGYSTRLSTHTNTASNPTARAINPYVTGDARPTCSLLANANTNVAAPAATRIAPPISRRIAAIEASRLPSGKYPARAITSTPTGTLIQSTQRQPSASVIRPPKINPATKPLAATAVQAPNARLRDFSSGNSASSNEKAAGEKSAAPKPCMARVTMSIAGLCEKPPSNEPRVKITRPSKNTRRRPNMSAARPPNSRNPAMATP